METRNYIADDISRYHDANAVILVAKEGQKLPIDTP